MNQVRPRGQSRVLRSPDSGYRGVGRRIRDGSNVAPWAHRYCRFPCNWSQRKHAYFMRLRPNSQDLGLRVRDSPKDISRPYCPRSLDSIQPRRLDVGDWLRGRDYKVFGARFPWSFPRRVNEFGSGETYVQGGPITSAISVSLTCCRTTRRRNGLFDYPVDFQDKSSGKAKTIQLILDSAFKNIFEIASIPVAISN